MRCFYSHSFDSKDDTVVDWFRRFLKSFPRIEVIEAGTGHRPPLEEVERLIDGSELFCAVCTCRNGAIPQWVSTELGYAQARKKKIFGFVEDGIDDLGSLESILAYQSFQLHTLGRNAPDYVQYVLNVLNIDPLSEENRMPLDIKRMSWDDFHTAVNKLNEAIRKSDFFPEVALSVGRAGAIAAGMVAGNLGAIRILGVDRKWHERDGKRRSVTIVPPVERLAEELKGKKVLCVMAECESGLTLERLVKETRKICGRPAVKSAAVIQAENSVFPLDYFGEQVRVIKEFPFRSWNWIRPSRISYQGPIADGQT
jgi:hypoxanthine phosphoribosyltransferase